MNTKITEKQIKEQLNNNEEKAKKLLDNEQKLDLFLDNLEQKLKKIPKLGEELSKVPVLINLVRDYKNKRYIKIPVRSIISIVSALIYFLSPVDLIPDSIPVIGMIDDAFILNFVLKMVNHDLDLYIKWRNEKKSSDSNNIVFTKTINTK